MAGNRPKSRIARTAGVRKSYAEHTQGHASASTSFCGLHTARERQWVHECFTDVTACLRANKDWLEILTKESARLSGKVARLKRAESRNKSASKSASKSAAENIDLAAANAAADAAADPIRSPGTKLHHACLCVCARACARVRARAHARACTRPLAG